MAQMGGDDSSVELLVGGWDQPSATPARQRSDSADFETFFRSHLGEVVAIARALAWSGEDPEDLAQEVMVRTYRNWSRVSGYDAPVAWVRRVCLNLALSRRRRLLNEAKAWRRHNARPVSPSTGADAAGVDPLWEQVRLLPRRQAEAVALFYICDLSVAEIALVQKCSVGTVKVHLSRARATLARQLGQAGEDE
jgi:RNA polymerase sigma-70 factor (ECF subfamily)